MLTSMPTATPFTDQAYARRQNAGFRQRAIQAGERMAVFARTGRLSPVGVLQTFTQ